MALAPTVLLTAGVHGDEYEGQVTLTKLVKEITPDQVNGQIIIVPMTNFPAANAGLRTSPIDDLNLNREFPDRYIYGLVQNEADLDRQVADLKTLLGLSQ